MPDGTIIILNGPSSSGKSSLVRALQELLPEPYLDAGLDKFLWMLPRRYLNEPDYWQQIFTYRYRLEEKETVIDSIAPASYGDLLVRGMHRAQAVLARSGNNMVADHVLICESWVADCAGCLADLPAWLIGVRCPLEVLEARERQRKDRTLGQARAQFDVVHAHGIYDFEVDTSVMSPENCAWAIRQHIGDGSAPQALKVLCQRLQS
jgi:chloramphenicol 3-O phosphotransferase